jgi:hypothetical protein
VKLAPPACHTSEIRGPQTRGSRECVAPAAATTPDRGSGAVVDRAGSSSRSRGCRGRSIAPPPARSARIGSGRGRCSPVHEATGGAVGPAGAVRGCHRHRPAAPLGQPPPSASRRRPAAAVAGQRLACTRPRPSRGRHRWPNEPWFQPRGSACRHAAAVASCPRAGPGSGPPGVARDWGCGRRRGRRR